MYHPDFKRRLMDLQDLPTLPEVMVKLLEVLGDEGSSARDLTRLLETDHAISARVLRLANSAFFALPRAVESIQRAVVVIGFEAVKNLALATSVIDTFARVSQLALDPRDFWMHCLGTANASRLLAETRSDRSSPEACFTAGLLHDVGKYAMALALKEEYREVVGFAAQYRRPLLEMEQDALKTNHTEVGTWLAEKWHFPKLIVEVIRGFYGAPKSAGPFSWEVTLIRLAERLAVDEGFGTGGDPHDRVAKAPLMEVLAISSRECNDISRRLRSGRKDVLLFFESSRQPI